jgi:4-hydroxy-tetrahydrodipicolinate synthase
MMNRLLEGEAQEAAKIHRRLLPLINALFVVPNPMPVKWALNSLGFSVGKPRLPLTEPDEKSASLIQATLEDYEIDLPIPRD